MTTVIYVARPNNANSHTREWREQRRSFSVEVSTATIRAIVGGEVRTVYTRRAEPIVTGHESWKDRVKEMVHENRALIVECALDHSPIWIQDDRWTYELVAVNRNGTEHLIDNVNVI